MRVPACVYAMFLLRLRKELGIESETQGVSVQPFNTRNRRSSSGNCRCLRLDHQPMSALFGAKLGRVGVPTKLGTFSEASMAAETFQTPVLVRRLIASPRCIGALAAILSRVPDPSLTSPCCRILRCTPRQAYRGS